jgi:peptidoglycan/LPS O-acetylase OafA/YrhL
LVLLGTVSLGFYLFHLAVMGNVQEWLAPSGTSSAFYGSLPAVFGLTFVLSIALAFLSYYLVEKPFLRLKDRPLVRRRPSVDA